MTESALARTLAAGVVAAQAQAMTVEQARKQIAPFYEMLNQPATKDLKALAEQALSPDWKSYSSETEFKGREAFIGQAAGFGKLIPDLRRNIKEVLVDGNRIIVRSEASGTPAGPFFGVQPSGKGFRIVARRPHHQGWQGRHRPSRRGLGGRHPAVDGEVARPRRAHGPAWI